MDKVDEFNWWTAWRYAWVKVAGQYAAECGIISYRWLGY